MNMKINSNMNKCQVFPTSLLHYNYMFSDNMIVSFEHLYPSHVSPETPTATPSFASTPESPPWLQLAGFEAYNFLFNLTPKRMPDSCQSEDHRGIHYRSVATNVVVNTTPALHWSPNQNQSASKVQSSVWQSCSEPYYLSDHNTFVPVKACPYGKERQQELHRLFVKNYTMSVVQVNLGDTFLALRKNMALCLPSLAQKMCSLTGNCSNIYRWNDVRAFYSYRWLNYVLYISPQQTDSAAFCFGYSQAAASFVWSMRRNWKH